MGRALLALALPSIALGQAPLPNIEAIDRTIRVEVDSGFRGVVLVAWHDSVLLRSAYFPADAPLRPSHPFWIASMTKGFTGAAVLRLEQEGRLRVTDTIGSFFKDAPRDKRGITIHQLLTHTAGLGGEYSGGGIVDRTQAVEAILAPALIHPPGAGYKYGDDDYELLAAIIEIASGVSWEDYVRIRLLEPLQLSSIGFACSSLSPPSHVTCDWGRKGANGMYGTAEDLLRWSRSVQAQDISRPRILVRKEPPLDVWYGYGVRVYTLDGKVTEVMHSGSGDDDHTSIVRTLSSGFTVIVLSNAGRHGDTTWASFVARRVVGVLLGA